MGNSGGKKKPNKSPFGVAPPVTLQPTKMVAGRHIRMAVSPIGEGGWHKFAETLPVRKNFKRVQRGDDKEGVTPPVIETTFEHTYGNTDLNVTLALLDGDHGKEKNTIAENFRKRAPYLQGVDLVMFIGPAAVLATLEEQKVIQEFMIRLTGLLDGAPYPPIYFLTTCKDENDVKTGQEAVSLFTLPPPEVTPWKGFCPSPTAFTVDQVDFLIDEMCKLLERAKYPPGYTINLRNQTVSGGGTPSKFTITRGSNMQGKNAHCLVYLGNSVGNASTQKMKTKAKDGANPVWGAGDDTIFSSFDLEKNSSSTLFIEICPGMGFCSIAVSDLECGEMELKIKALKKEKVSGSIFIQVE